MTEERCRHDLSPEKCPRCSPLAVQFHGWLEPLKRDAEMWRIGRAQGLISDDIAQKIGFVWGQRVDS